MKGFKCIEDLSITDCCCFFKIKPSDLPEIIGSIQENPEHKEIKKHLLQLIKKDNHDFASCSTIEQYKKYLNSWKDGLHRDEATKKIAELKSEAEEFAFYTKSMNSISDCKTYIKKYPYGRYINKVSAKLDDMSFKSCTFKSEYEQYLVKFPHGLHVIEAKEKVNKIDKTKRIGLIVLIIFIALCILGYNRAGRIEFANIYNTEQYKGNSTLKLSLAYSYPKTLMLPFVVISQSSDTKNLSFPKEGGIKEVEFTSGANNDNIEVTSSKSWINAIKISDGKIKISVTKNEGEKRYGYVEVKAYSTLFGIRTSSTTGTISIEQETGHASRINVSSDEITFNNNGGSKDVRIESDGYFHIVGNSPDWITITKHNNSISFNVKENQGTYRTYNYGIESGSIKKNIKISQAGKSATRLNVSTDDISFSPSGGSRSITVSTDGEWHISTRTDDWGHTSINGNTIILTVGENNGEYRTDYFVIKSGSIEKRINISQGGKSATHLSASPDNVSFSSSGGTRTITISTDGEWRISTGTAGWGHTSISGNTITLRIDENTSSSSRTDYFVIKSGSKEKRINISQDGKPATRLSVSTENVSFGKDGGRRTITVSTNGEWRIGVGTASWAHTSISGNTITLRVDENYSGDERTDYFTVVAGDKDVRINITQAGGPSAEVNRVWVEHNIQRTGYNSVMGPWGWQQVPYTYNVMRIHVDFDVENMKGKTIRVCAFFYDEDGDKMRASNNNYRTSDGQVSVQDKTTPRYESSNYSDFTMEIPYSAITKGDNKFVIQIQDNNGEYLGESDYEYFTRY